MELSLLNAIHPDLRWKSSWSDALRKALFEKAGQPWDLTAPAESIPVQIAIAYLVWFANLGEAAAVAIGKRLHFSNGSLEALQTTTRLFNMQERLQTMSVSEFTGTLHGVPDFANYAFFCLTDNETIKERVLHFLSSWRSLEPFTSGEKLKTMGVPPGPRYALILAELKRAKLDGKIINETQEKEMLERLIQSY
jgi:tRNA nucleotidyltransferase/poly(A) polymerase